MRHDTPLAGCTPTPLIAYLKALGVLRLVAEQADLDAAAWWDHDRLTLRSRLDQPALMRFLLEDYQPTPILAPWSGDSGFYKSQSKAWKKGLSPLLRSRARRFQDYREALEQAQAAVAASGLKESPSGREKEQLLVYLRGQLPDQALPWLDAAVLLTDDGVKAPPLLGSGGNDGRLDFSAAFIQRLLELLDEHGQPRPLATSLLNAALFAAPVAGLTADTGGQFTPGAVEAPNSTTGFQGEPLINPWDSVLGLEGAVLFAAAATRRLQTGDKAAPSFPFTLYPAGAGHGSLTTADEAPARPEIWLPLWTQPAGLWELRALLAEGRLTLKSRLARNGLDAARAVAILGADRGLTAFQRYGFLKRAGRNYLATPLNRLPVRRNPQADLISDLDRNAWLNQLRRLAADKKASARLVQLAGRLQNAVFALTQERGPELLQRVLMALGALQYYLAVSPRLQDQLPPVPWLRAAWIAQADDGSHEFRLAAALASLASPGCLMAAHLAPIILTRGQRQWAKPEDSAAQRRRVWTDAPLAANLIRVLQRRLLEAEQGDEPQDKPLAGGVSADAAALAAFLQGTVNEERLTALLHGLACAQAPARLTPRPLSAAPLPGAYALLKPLFTPDRTLHALRVLGEDRRLPIPPGLVNRLAQGATDSALTLAWRRARGSGLPVLAAPPSACGLDGQRLAAALLIPLAKPALKRLLARAYPSPAAAEAEQDAMTVID